MNEAIKELRNFFKSDLWTKACLEDQPVISDNGIVLNKDNSVGLDTKINLALDFEGKFNDFARAYMQWRKDNNK